MVGGRQGRHPPNVQRSPNHGQVLTVAPGDTLILPADAPRRITADCAVPDGDKLIPA